jgi:hypothetical protein
MTSTPIGTTDSASRRLISGFGQIAVLFVQRSEEHALQHPEHVGRADHDAQGADDRHGTVDLEGADEDERLADKTREAW